MERTTLVADFGKIRSVEVFIVVVCCRLVEIVLGVGPVPFIAAELGPVVECSGATANPGVVVDRAATTKDSAAGVGFLWPINHGRLVSPIILASAQLEGASWSCDFGDFGSVAGSISTSRVVWGEDIGQRRVEIPLASFNNEHSDLWALGQTAGYNANQRCRHLRR